MKNFIASVATLAAAFTASAADWPQYHGVQSDRISREPIQKKWPADGLKQVWKRPLNLGFSSFSVSNGKAYTLEQRSVEGVNREVCVALDANTGKELWHHVLGIAKYDNGHDAGPDDGPRSTPTIDKDRVYVMSAQLLLVCLDANSGKVLWSKDILKEHSGKNITWQNAASPLLDGDLLFVAGGGPGEALLGINKTDGKVVWKGQDDKMTHATPVAATIHGTRQIIFFTQTGLVSVAPKTGDVLWRHKFRFNVSTAASPIVADDIVYCAAGYGVGSSAARIVKSENGWQANQIWRNEGNKICNHWSTPVYYKGHLYGLFSFKQYKTGPLKCVDLATGQEKWSVDGFGAGNLIMADNHLLVLTDQGELVLAEPNPEAYKEVSRVKAVDGKCWSTPIVSNGRIFARSSKEGVCLDVSAKVTGK